MLSENTIRRRIAMFLACNILIEIFAPSMSYALTGGPSQPEVDSFEPVNTTQMVDLFTGDFNYNIPLIDAGGYPVNISYHAGIGMEQEASWVGLGWNINVGNITRNVRGIPDDFKGDSIEKEFNMKPNNTLSLGIGADLQVFGISTKKAAEIRKNLKSNEIQADSRLKKLSKLSRWEIDLGIVSNSYRGMGIDLSGGYTALKENNYVHIPIGLGINSQSGSSWNASVIFGKNLVEQNKSGGVGSIGLGYSSLNGLKSTSISGAYNYVGKSKYISGSYGIACNTAIGLSSFTPSFQFSMQNMGFGMHLTLGSELTGRHGNITLNGSYNSQWLEKSKMYYNAYGYLYDQKQIKNADKSKLKSDKHLMLDFNRINDGSFNSKVTNMPVATGTYDVLSVQGQGTGGSYRAHRNGASIYFDPIVTNSKNKNSLNPLNIGIELGLGANTHTSFPLNISGSYSQSGGWVDENELFEHFYSKSDGENFEDVFIKSASDGGPNDAVKFELFGSNSASFLELEKLQSNKSAGNKFSKINISKFNSKNGKTSLPKYKNLKRVSRNSTFSFLSNKETQSGMGLETSRNSYSKYFWEHGTGVSVRGYFGTGRKSPKAHHIGEVTQTNPDGSRYVYGLPQINKYQKEVVFNVAKANDQAGASTHENQRYQDKELVGYLPGTDDQSGNTRGSDNFFQSTITPAFSHSYLLTGVLSPDYVDVLGDGITNDDLGNAVKFNYNLASENYKWRAPYEKNMARLNNGFLSDNLDDKGSYVYGEKELWYLHSIESKTHVAIFKVSQRNDGLGVKDSSGGMDSTSSSRMMKLDSIVLYSKLDLLKNGSNATPVKTVVFKYSYELCKNIPNNKNFQNSTATGPGKLTLKEIYFTYGKNNRGQLSPYKFQYTNSNPDYGLANFDCWGNYKSSTRDVPNREFPYLDPLADTSIINQHASSWCLNKVKLPSGGEINIEYEADDYAYVQDQKAMSMMMIEGMAKDANGLKGDNDKLYDNGKKNTFIYFKNPDPLNITNSSKAVESLFKDENNQYLKELYYRVKVNMNPYAKPNNTAWEYVNGWDSIKTVDSKPNVGISGDLIWVELAEVSQGDVGMSSAHPIAKNAWQFAIDNLGPIVFPGSAPKSRDKNAFMGLLNSVGTTLNIVTGPYENLKWRKIASKFKPLHSYVRLYHHNQYKKGGGVRVRKLFINDNWQNMYSGQTNGEYGQKFEYSTKNAQGKNISSGVASWEPFIGGDQNPHHKPNYYVEKVLMGPNKRINQNNPNLESLYPPATVGYSVVKVTSIGNSSSPRSSTGFTLNEFYTAKDFPVVERFSELQQLTNGTPDSKFLKSLFSPIYNDKYGVSQGYVLHLNDMHGKVKSVKNFGEVEGSGINIISGTHYKYLTSKLDPKILDNHVDLLTDSGSVVNAELAMDYDVDFDVRESYSTNWKSGTKLGFDQSGAFIVPHVIPTFKRQTQFLQSVVTCKVIQRYGIIDEVTTYDYGSAIVVKNLLWDKESGTVLLTRTKNEFEDPIYNFQYPAHLAYDRMGGAYQNIDYAEYDRLVGNNGMCSVSNSSNFIPGDEVLLTNTVNEFSRAWVLNSGENKIKLIDRSGLPIPNGKYDVRIIRSGNRNMLAANVGSATLMSNPLNLVNGKLYLTDKIVNTTALEFSENWQATINSFSKFDHVCDTIDPGSQFVLAAAYLKKLSIEDSSSHLLYEYQGLESANPLNLQNLYWFDTSSLKNYFDSFYLNQVPSSCIKEYYVGQTSANNSSSFAFQLRFRCDTIQPWTYINTCDFLMGGGEWSNLDSIVRCRVNYDVYNRVNFAWVYDSDGDSTAFDIPIDCFGRLIRCKEVLSCQNTLGSIVNPYVNGVRGIWRPKNTWVFVGKRKYKYAKDSTDIRKDGLIENYTPFWTFSSTGLKSTGKLNKHWVNSNTVTLYSATGNGLEEKDALGIFKSQLIGYDNTLVIAEANNAQYREIAFDNFEDYNYLIGNCEIPGHFDFRNGMLANSEWKYLSRGRSKYQNFNNPSQNVYIRKDTAHSGLHSIVLKPNVNHALTRFIDTSIYQKLTVSDTGLFRINDVKNTVPLFSPNTNKRYIISAWVTEDISNKNAVSSFQNAVINVKTYNSGSVSLNQNFTANGLIIEGWQKVDGSFTIPANADSIRVTLINQSNSHKSGFDDIRIQPFNSQMKGHVYNPILMKVMAELDENNYTTFYEYDAEGNLVRIKKETVRGIMTIKEYRKGFQKTK